MKIRVLRAEFFHLDGQTDGYTDTTKLDVACSNFAYASRKHECDDDDYDDSVKEM
jgi:hypothetical protein